MYARKLVRTSTTCVARGMDLVHSPSLNKGTAFTEVERDALGLRGLLPPHVHTMEEQIARVMENFHREHTDLGKYIHLLALQDRNETLFYRVLLDHLEEMMPIVYTPTVGRACLDYGHIFRRTRGFFVALKHRGRMAHVLRNWPFVDVRVVVVTDGERILGLGDLGADGMGIPIGKLSLYTACAGIHPSDCLPIMLDVGTDNDSLLNDPLYIGSKERRLRGARYDEFVEEFVSAVHEVFPHALIQFEDFANANAFRLLRAYRDRICTFNDDIQGTGSVVLAGLLSALRITNVPLTEQRILFLGAGEAAIGVGDQIVAAMKAKGLEDSEARARCWFFDVNGLVVRGREPLAEEHVPYAHDRAHIAEFHQAVEALRPTAIIGAAAQPGMFSKRVLETMAAVNERPIVFALSNPTSKAECTPQEAYGHTGGRAVYASGSPFGPVTSGGRTFAPGQANNVYIFPGVGLGVVACGVRRVTDEMFHAAARALAGQATEDDLAAGRIYPQLTRIREVSALIATAVAEVAYREDLASLPRPRDLYQYVKSQMYEPVYESYV